MAEVLLAPFSNSALRDWPHFSVLISLFVDKTDLQVTVVGSAGQRAATDRLVRDYPATRVVNMAGVLPWPAVVERVRAAALVVANNSGLAHLASEFGAPTVCIFSASHSPYEWMARGPRTTVVVKETTCSPCAYDVLDFCPYGVRCLSEIEADTVFDLCLARLQDSREPES
jgi:ADP-heptose:LPS heptosyltransferase